MGLEELVGKKWSAALERPEYKRSPLNPQAPENTIGEVLVGSAYRTLVLGIHENRVDLEESETLSERLATLGDLPEDGWDEVFEVGGGLGSPRLGGQRGPAAFRQLSPYVPEMARYSAVLGRASGRRWNPGALLLEALAAGTPRADREPALARLATALSVDETDDLLARYVEGRLAALPELDPRPSTLPQVPDGLDRIPGALKATPAERFGRDLRTAIQLKPRQTRKQWVVLLEALFRLGLPTHYLWNCRLNSRIWDLVLEIIDRTLRRRA